MSQDGTPPDNRNLFNAGAQALSRIRSSSVNPDQQPTSDSSEQLTVHRYPSNVGDIDIPHYVMFFISKRRADIGTQEQASADLQVDLSGANRPILNNRRVLDFLTQVGVTLGAATGFSNVAKAATNAFGASDTIVGTTARTFAGGVGAGAGFAASGEITGGEEGARDRVTLKKCIALYVTGTPSTSYKAIWQDKDIGIIGGADQFLSNVGEAYSASGLLAAAGEALKSSAPAVAAIGLANAPKVEGVGDIQGLITSNQGIAVNPFRTQLFQNMGFRSFSFNYNFQPRNMSEYQEVKEIIKTFKKYMHPTLGEDRIIMGYPGEFSIAYYYGSGENSELFRIGNCALTDLSVTYGGTDMITFQGTGIPAEINLSLQFTELEVLTEQRIEEGY